MKQLKCLLGGERVRVDRHKNELRRSCPCGGLKHFYGAFLLGFLWLLNLAFPGSESVFGISQGPPMCPCASLSQAGF